MATHDTEKDLAMLGRLLKKNDPASANRQRPVEEDVYEGPETVPEDTGLETDRREEAAAGGPVPELDDDTMRITMLGISGAGKTAFLSGVYQTLVGSSVGSFRLEPSGIGNSGFIQIGKLSEIALVNLGYRFPNGTEKTTLFPLELRSQDKKICSFTFMDYRGGDTEDLFGISRNGAARPTEMNEEADQLKEYLVHSQAIMLFVDAVALSKGSSLTDWKANTYAYNLIPGARLLFAEMKKREPLKPRTLLIVITKVDDVTIPSRLKENNYQGLTDRAWEVFGCLQKQGDVDASWSFGIIPVSAVGEGNSAVENGVTIVKEKHAPEPYNIDKAMIYTIACILSQWRHKANEDYNSQLDEYVRAGRKNNLAGRVLAKVMGREDPKDLVTRKLESVEAKQREIITYISDIQQIARETGAIEAVRYRNDQLSGKEGWG